MKTIGMVGGFSWYSSVEYYRIINEQVNSRLGGDEAARMILFSVNFAEIKRLTYAGNWKQIGQIIGTAAKATADAGADCLIIGANTMHKVADDVQAAISIPVIHIADATATAIQQKELTKVALLGTKFTMQLDFYKNKLAVQGIATIIPDEQEIEMVNDSIYNELGKGIILPETKQQYIELIDKLVQQGAQGIILGCTEIPLLIKQEDCPVPVFDTTLLHATAAVDFALAK